ncbi:MAG: metallophosphoesterase [Clostridia bacterium]|nr:metallophosphoesterase [Clostridia bacterium]
MILKRIKAVICLPMAFFTLVTGLSFVSQTRQEELEAKLAESIEGDFVPVFRFAIASDVHISESDPTTAERFAKLFETAYRYADAHPTYNSLDAVLLAGDNCNSGSDGEYAILNAVVAENKREGTEFITIMGNHEFATTGHEGYVRNMGEELDKHVVVKGYHIIGLSPDPKDTWHTPGQLIWLNRELSKAAADDPDKPIFTMQHGHIWNTVYVSRSWYTQMSLPLHLVYAQFPQVINFSGHSHGPVNNPLEIWQNSYTQLGTGTLNYFEMERDIGDNTVPEGSRNAAQYLIVEVDAENRVRIQPYNILTDDFMKTPSNTDDPDKQLIYQIDEPGNTSSYVYTSARKKTATKPRFDSGAAVSVDSVTADSVTVSFSQALADECVYGYRVTVTDPAKRGKKVAEKEIYSEYYFEPMPETLSCTVGGLSAGREYNVTVVPLNVWLQAGDGLTASFTTAES